MKGGGGVFTISRTCSGLLVFEERVWEKVLPEFFLPFAVCKIAAV